MSTRIFSSESVTEGHPDKICDIVSDTILDAILEQDPFARVACETTITIGLVHLLGEVTANCTVQYETLVREAIREIGYTQADFGFDADACSVISSLHNQSPDIALGVDHSLESKLTKMDYNDIGAGDQGMMIGFACDETNEYMPMSICLAHKLTKRLAYVRKEGIIPYLRPDGKAQISIEYDEERVIRADTIVIAAQHRPDITQWRIQRDVMEHVVKAVIPECLVDNDTKYLINTTGRFAIGGPKGDAGLTGRKIIVDTYGGYASHGGGSFSGKDPTKMDRTGCYAARYIAKNIVASNLAKKCEIQLAYAIGVANPVSIYVNTYGTGKLQDDRISCLIKDKIDLRPTALIERFNLRKPIYKKTAAYGHFGRTDLELPWEKKDIIDFFS